MRIEKGEKTQEKVQIFPPAPPKSLLNKSAELKRLHHCDLISLFISPSIASVRPASAALDSLFLRRSEKSISFLDLQLFLCSSPPFFFLNPRLLESSASRFGCVLSASYPPDTWGGEEIRSQRRGKRWRRRKRWRRERKKVEEPMWKKFWDESPRLVGKLGGPVGAELRRRDGQVAFWQGEVAGGWSFARGRWRGRWGCGRWVVGGLLYLRPLG